MQVIMLGDGSKNIASQFFCISITSQIYLINLVYLSYTSLFIRLSCKCQIIKIVIAPESVISSFLNTLGKVGTVSTILFTKFYFYTLRAALVCCGS